MTPEEEAMELGFRSELLLQSETFKYVINHLNSLYVNNILLSEPHEAKTRESNYLLNRALNDIVSMLAANVQVKDALILAREAKETEEENG